MPKLREIVPLNEGVLGAIGRVGRAVGHHAKNVVRNYHLLRYRAASVRKVLGMSKIKQKIKTATGINFVQRWTDKNRLKQRIKGKKILGFSWYNNRAMTKYREIKNHRYVRTFNNMQGHHYGTNTTRANHSLRFSKLRPKDKAKARVHSRVRRVKAFKPPKQSIDLAKR